MDKSVVIVGGGVAGMSAAHELIERGFKVSVYEKRGVAGGKARSVGVPDTGQGGRRDLPGEHGFRFFPGFYRHVIHTMKRIPFKNRTVYDNLVDTTRIQLVRNDKPPVLMLARFPRSIEEMKIFLRSVFESDLGLTDEEIYFFLERLWQFLTSCKLRRFEEYEQISWWEYVDAQERSPVFQRMLAEGLTRTLVAAQARLLNARTGASILIQLLSDLAKPFRSSDRVLNGPTNEVWIDPWLDHLKQQGVDYHLNATVERINFSRKTRTVESVTVTENGVSVKSAATTTSARSRLK